MSGSESGTGPSESECDVTRRGRRSSECHAITTTKVRRRTEEVVEKFAAVLVGVEAIVDIGA